MEIRMNEWVLRLAEELTQIIPVGQPFVKQRYPDQSEAVLRPAPDLTPHQAAHLRRNQYHGLPRWRHKVMPVSLYDNGLAR
jgi:hypothetical protein